MGTSWEKLVQYVGASYGHDISNELQNKLAVVLPEPEYKLAILMRHGAKETMVRDGQSNLRAARDLQRASLQKIMDTGNALAETPFKLAVVKNEIAQGDFDVMSLVLMVLTDTKKTSNSNAWRSYCKRNANLLKHRRQAYSLILGQCNQLLHDKLKQEPTWAVVSVSYNPLQLYRSIYRVIPAQTEDQYPFATIYDQEQSLFLFRQENMTSAQWYERFNTKIDVGTATGVTRQHE